MKRITAVMLLLLASQLPLHAAQFTARGEATARLGDYYEVEFLLTGDKKPGGDPQFPDFTGFKIVSGPNSSQSTSIINGTVSQNRSWSFVLAPQREGKLAIQPAQIRLGGTPYATQTLWVVVSDRAGEKGQEPSEIFLRATVSNLTPYQGEQIIYQLRVYFRVNVQNYQPEGLQRTAGFIVEEFPLPRQPAIYQETIDGIQYNVAVIQKLALFPTVTGDLEIPSSATSFDVVKRRRSQRRGDIFDQFFSSGMMENFIEQQRLVTKAIRLDIKPLPEPAPADFSGMVGSFTLQTQIDRTSLVTNEPLTFTATVKGRGNIKMIPEFQLQLPHDIEAYPPEVESDINRRDLISGFKRFKYLLVPRHPGEQQIKPLHFSYFNPATGDYVSLESQEINLQVERSDDYYPGGGAILRSGEPIQTYGVDIEYIHTATPDFKRLHSSFLGSGFFILLLLTPWLLPLAAWGRRRYQDSQKRNRDMHRFRQARSNANRLLKKAQHSLRQKEEGDYYAQVTQTLVNYLADKRGLAAAGLVWEEELQQLRDQGVDAAVIDEMALLRQQCDYARFAASKELPEATDIIPRSETILDRLERLL
ncbi:MAG: protein BatD [Candidatus Delongbacteria bacterium]|nr:protein BatD [Candidatus Delongbacteria bacterium]